MAVRSERARAAVVESTAVAALPGSRGIVLVVDDETLARQLLDSRLRLSELDGCKTLQQIRDV
jgi:hypothetical protein